MEVQSSDIEIKLGGAMTAITDSSPIDIKIGGTPTPNNKKPKIESLWCNLPGNVLIFIIERLCYVDQIYFRAVCKDWRSKIYRSVRRSDNFPWILVASTGDTLSRNIISISNQCYLFDPIHKQKYTIQNQILDGAQIHASKFGWLLLSRNTKSKYFFSFYSPFTNKIIELPELHMELSAGKIFRDAMATFSTAPTSSDCVICVVSTEPTKKDPSGSKHLFIEEFCVSTCSPGGGRGKTWNNVLLGMNCYKYDTVVSRIAHVDGVFYFIFEGVDDLMGAFKPGLQEWKAYPYPRLSFLQCIDCLIDSEDNENLLMSYYHGRHKTWHVWQFNKAEKNWCELEKLGSRMLFVSATSTSLQLAASAKDEEEEEEDGEGMGSFANTIHVAYGIYPHLECSSQFYKKVDNHPSCSQIYGWIDKEGLSSQISDWLDMEVLLRLIWIEPPNMYF
ncbi:hypothetical protein LWI29_010227 [Acer saccharum]|uniref:F-box domain-containing protein n=1 Tax=Acer saccharum TaxID=4024 RepID=A0AA39SVP4_ACESA|nr:hypothetical protein LWI29_010227 [Acer saccharum]